MPHDERSADASQEEGLPPSLTLDETVSLPTPGSNTAETSGLASTMDSPAGLFTRATSGVPPRQIGNYELLEEIARGGMGIVYKARHISLKRSVALKMILAGQFAGDAEVQRFHTEAEAAAKLDHPHIVPIYEVGQQAGQHFLAMAFVSGGSLAAKITDSVFASVDAARMVRTIALAIAYAHSKGVVHRDLKPANVLLDEQGEPRVTDFGLAKQIESDSGLTSTGQILGTPSYMPPEQARGETDRVGTLSDVYSLGAILYCLLTGRPPFKAATTVDTVLQVIGEVPVAPRDMNPTVPVDLETICLKCLEKAPEARYASAADLADDLQRYLEMRPIVARPISRVAKALRWCRRNPVLASSGGIVAAVLVCASVVSSMFAWQSRISEHSARLSSQQLGQQVQVANAATQKAITQSAIAEEQTRRAEDSKQEALAALTIAEQNQYRSNIQRASEALRDGRFGDFRDALARCPMALRKVEWSLLHRQLFMSTEMPRIHRKALLDADERRLYGLWQDRLRCLNMADLREEFAIQSSDFRFSDFVVSADGTSIITADEKAVRRWNATTGELLGEGAQQFVAGNGSTRLALLPNAKKLFVYGSGIALLDLESWEVAPLAPPRSSQLSGSHYRFLVVAPNGRDLAWATSAGGLVLAEWTEDKLFFRNVVKGLNSVEYLAFSRDGAQVMTAGKDGVAIISTSKGEIDHQVVIGSVFNWADIENDTVLAMRGDGVLEQRSVAHKSRSLEIPIASSQHNRLPDVTHVARVVQRPELLVSTEESCHLVSLSGPQNSVLIPAAIGDSGWTTQNEIWGVEEHKRHNRLVKYDLETDKSEVWDLDDRSCFLAPLARTVVSLNPDQPKALSLWRLGVDPHQPANSVSSQGPEHTRASFSPLGERRNLSLDGKIGSRAINRQGTALAIVTDDQVLQIYDPSQMKLINRRKLHAASRVLKFSDDGERLALQTKDSAVLEIVSWRTNETLQRIESKVELLLDVGADDRPCVTLLRDKVLLLANGKTQRKIRLPFELSSSPKSSQFAVTADGTRLVTLLGDGYLTNIQQFVAICDLQTGDLLAQVPVPPAQNVGQQRGWTSVGLLEARDALYLSNGSVTMVLPLESAASASSLTLPSRELAGVTLVDNLLFIEDEDLNAWVTDVTTGRTHAVNFSTDAKSRIVASGKGRVFTVDNNDYVAAHTVSDGELLWRLAFPQARRCGWRCLEASDRMVLIEHDGSLRLLDGSSGKVLTSQPGLSAATNLVAVAQRVDVMAIVTKGGGLYLWDVDARTLRQLHAATSQAQRGAISALALAPDASSLALARTDIGTVEVYSTAHDKLVHEVDFLSRDFPKLMPHSASVGQPVLEELPLPIYGLEFSEDGKLLLAIGLEYQSQAFVFGQLMKSVLPMPVTRLKAWDGALVKAVAQYPSMYGPAVFANRTTVMERVDDTRLEISQVDLSVIDGRGRLRGDIQRASQPGRMAVTPAVLGARQASGHPLWIDTLHPRGRVLGCAITPDGKSVIGTDCSGVVRQWRLDSGELVAAFVGHRGEALACDVSPTAAVAATAGKDGTVRLWDLVENRELRRVTASQPWGPIRALAMHPKTQVFAATSQDSGLQVWDGALGIPTIELPEAGRDNYSLAWSPDGQSLATAGYSASVQVWDLFRRRVQIELPLGATPISPAVEWSPDGKRIAACDGPDVTIWDATTGKRQLRLETPNSLKAMKLTWSHDGQSIASGGQGSIWLWNTATGALQHALTVDGDVLDLAFGNDDQVIVKGGRGSVELWDVGTQQRRWRVPVLPEVTSVAYLDNGSRLAASTFNQVAVWNPRDPVSHQQVAPHGASWLAATDAGSRLAMVRGWQAGIQIWDSKTNQTSLLTEQNRFKAVAWTSDGSRLAALSTDGTTQVWDAVVGTLLQSAPGTPNALRLNWSRGDADLTLLAIGQDLLRWRLANPEGFEQLKNVRSAIAFSKDGSQALAKKAFRGAELSQWNNGMGRHIASYEVPSDEKVVEFAMDKDENHAATFGLHDGDLYLFDLDSSNVTRWLSPTLTDIQWGPGKWLAVARCDGVIDLFDATHQRRGVWMPLQNGEYLVCAPDSGIQLSNQAHQQLIIIEENARGIQVLKRLEAEVINGLNRSGFPSLSDPASFIR